MNDFQTISIGPAFFKKERKQIYSQWQIAWFREMFQNSIDAGATQIKVDIAEVGDHVKIGFSDNGCGMTREVLEKVFFSLGETTKNSETTVGGFGRARILTCFSMLNYEIATGTLRVEGNGASYRITEEPVDMQGCVFEMTMDETTVEVMNSTLQTYLSECYFPDVEIYVNGQLQEETEDNIGIHVRDLVYDGKTWGSIFFTKDGPHRNAMVCRIGGMSMFRDYSSVDGQLTLVLEPSMSREVLNANRSSLQWSYAQMLNEIKEEFASDDQKLRPKPINKFEIFRGTGKLRAGGSKEVITARREGSKEGAAYNRAATGNDLRLAIREASRYPEVMESAMSGLPADPKTKEIIYRVSEFIPDVPMALSFYDNESGYVKSAERWNPANWTFRIQGNEPVWDGCRDKILFLLTWKLCVEEALRAYLTFSGVGSIEYRAGFYFSADQDAGYQNSEGHNFMICPVDDDGKIRFRLKDRMSLKEMMSCAKHEVAHLSSGYHNAQFVRAFDQIDQRFDEWELLKRIVSLKV